MFVFGAGNFESFCTRSFFFHYQNPIFKKMKRKLINYHVTPFVKCKGCNKTIQTSSRRSDILFHSKKCKSKYHRDNPKKETNPLLNSKINFTFEKVENTLEIMRKAEINKQNNESRINFTF